MNRRSIGCFLLSIFFFSTGGLRAQIEIGEGPMGSMLAAKGAGRAPIALLGQERSPAVATLLDIAWVDAEWPMRDDPGYGLSALPLSAIFGLAKEADRGKPAIVYVRGDQKDGDAELAEEMKLFGSEALIVATRLFRCFRIHESTVLDASSRKKYLGSMPAFVFLDAKGNELGIMNGPVTHQRLLARLDAHHATHYEGGLRALLARAMKQLKEVEKAEDRAADLKRDLDYIEKQAEDGDTAGRQRRIAARRKDLDLALGEFDRSRKSFVAMMQPRAKPKD